jgi:hypothetical protein
MKRRWSFCTHSKLPRSRALNLVYGMPDGSSKAEVGAYAGDGFHLVYATTTTTWDSLGVVVHGGEIDLQMSEDFFSGPIDGHFRLANG